MASRGGGCPLFATDPLSEVPPQSTLEGKATGAMWTPVNPHIVVHVQVILIVVLHCKPFVTDITPVQELVQVEVVDVLVQPLAGGQNSIAILAEQCSLWGNKLFLARKGACCERKGSIVSLH